MEQLNFTETMMQTSNDICYNKHQGNEQSKAANKRVNKQADKDKIIHYLNTIDGSCTSKEIAEYLGKQLNQISGRFSELLADNIIEPIKINGVKITLESCQVYKLKNTHSVCDRPE